jgi:hypothetical protein
MSLKVSSDMGIILTRSQYFQQAGGKDKVGMSRSTPAGSENRSVDSLNMISVQWEK